MAVIPEIPGLTVTVNIDGKPAKEYESPERALPNNPTLNVLTDDELSICRYIESISDKSFTIVSKISSSFQEPRFNKYIVVDVEIDGEWVAWDWRYSGSCRSLRPKVITIDTAKIHSGTTGLTSMHELRFSEIFANEDTEKDVVAFDSKVAEHLGTIVVKISMVEAFNTSLDEPKSASLQQFSDRIELAEKSLKGRVLTHATRLCQKAIRKTPNEVIEFTGIQPICTFEFKYRSEAGLRNEMVLPLLKVSHAVDNDVLQMSVDELRQSVMESRLSREATVKRERDEEVMAVPAKRVKVKEVDGVLDITEDSD